MSQEVTPQFAIDYLLDDCEDCPECKDGECVTESHCFEVKQMCIKALRREQMICDICDECLKAKRDKCEKDISLKPKTECLIAYLEKIKTEFLDRCENYYRFDNEIILNGFEELINKYIDELKGETNEAEKHIC